MREHSKLQTGTRFINKRGEVLEILSYSHYEGNNHYYECMSLETGEVKKFQYSNIKHGKFTFEAKIIYEDKELHAKASQIYFHIRERIRKCKSYADVENEFESVLGIYQFLYHFFEDNPQLKEPFLKGELIIDKDLKSFISILEGYGRFKKYGPETILLVTKQENLSDIPKAIRSRDIVKLKDLEKKISERQVI